MIYEDSRRATGAQRSPLLRMRALAGTTREAVDEAREAERVALRALDHAVRSMKTSCVYHIRRVVAAQDSLADARRSATTFRGRRAVRRARQTLAHAESLWSQGRQTLVSGLVPHLTKYGFAVAATYKSIWRARDARRSHEIAKRAKHIEPRHHVSDLLKSQAGRCGICGTDFETLDDIHVDHIQPRHHGGKDNADNLQATHSLCNIRKGTQWERTMEAQIVRWAPWKIAHMARDDLRRAWKSSRDEIFFLRNKVAQLETALSASE